MELLFHIALLPVALTVLCALLPVNRFQVVVPIFLWLQVLVVGFTVWPALTGNVAAVRLTDDFAVEQLGSCFMLLTTVVVASCMTHARHYFNSDSHQAEPVQLRVFYGSACLFLLAMTTVFMSDNLGVLWIAVEATTLTSASMVFFERTKNAVEAAWKYLIICSVGIAFALLGTIFLFAAGQHGALGAGTLEVSKLIHNAQKLNFHLSRLGVIFCIIGYGTKAGMFPLHSWLPDAHSEAPAPASAMLSGGVLNCALFAIWKVTQIMSASHHRTLIFELVVTMGAITAVAASLMLIRQHSIKRMWAYSSIENVGIMLVAIGLNAPILFFLQAVNHSLAKVALFLVTGNVIQASGHKKLRDLHGLVAVAPAWAVVLVAGAFAVTGAPPFGMFVSELNVLSLSVISGHWPVALALLIAISISFVAVSAHVGRVVCGSARPGFKRTGQVFSTLMPAVLMACSALLGAIAIPQLWSGGR